MKLWLIFIQGDETTWLEDAWDDETTAQNPDGWQEAVAKARKGADENGYEMRIVSTTVQGVYDVFETPDLKASKAESA